MKSIKMLYRELLRQQKVCGLIFGIFSALTLCATLIILYTSEGGVPSLLSQPFAYVLMLVGGIVFPLSAFSYLNKRNSADIYHSIPASRMQLFIATAAACLSWLIGLLFAGYVASVIGYLLIGAKFSLWGILTDFLYFTVGTLAISAGTMIALSVAGTTLSALAGALVVNFVPRLILTIAAVGMASNGKLCMDDLGILSPQLNFSFGSSIAYMFAGLFDQNGTVTAHISAAYTGIHFPLFYTLLVAAVEFLIAAKLFARRKSEVAGSPASSALVQHIIRCGVASPFVLLIASIDAGVGGLGVDEVYFWIILLAGLGVYLVYELISNRSFRKTIKTTWLYVILTVVLLFGAKGFVFLGSQIANNPISADSVKSVSFTGDSQVYPGDNDYTRMLYGNLNFEDANIIELVTDAYNNPKKASSVTLRVQYNTAFGHKTRYVYVPTSSLYTLTGYTSADSRISKLLDAFPASSELIRLDSTGANMVNMGVAYSDKEKMRTLWDTVQEEYKALSSEEKLAYAIQNSDNAYMYQSGRMNDHDVLATLYFTGIHHGQYYTLHFNLDKHFPKTLDLLYQYSDQQKFIDKLKDSLRNESLGNLVNYASLYRYGAQGEFAEIDFYNEEGDKPSDATLVSDDQSIFEALESTEDGTYMCAGASRLKDLLPLLEQGKIGAPIAGKAYYELYYEEVEYSQQIHISFSILD